MIDFDAHIAAESARFRSALAGAELDAPVTTCPGWVGADLLWHLAEVQSFWGAIVGDRLSGPDGYTAPQRPELVPDLFESFDTAHERLMSSLSNAHDDDAVWTWAPSDQRVGFVRRRQAHEALIHRLDAEVSSGTRAPIDAALATDGVDEALHVMFGSIPSWASVTGSGPTGRVAAVDTGVDWIVQIATWSGTSPSTGTAYTDDRAIQIVDHSADRADIAFEVSGRAGDLDAWLWGRPTPGRVERVGDCSGIDSIVASGIR